MSRVRWCIMVSSLNPKFVKHCGGTVFVFVDEIDRASIYDDHIGAATAARLVRNFTLDQVNVVAINQYAFKVEEDPVEAYDRAMRGL